MSKLFVGYVVDNLPLPLVTVRIVDNFVSGLAWHTTDESLKDKFSEFGEVEEAVKYNLLYQ